MTSCEKIRNFSYINQNWTYKNEEVENCKEGKENKSDDKLINDTIS